MSHMSPGWSLLPQQGREAPASITTGKQDMLPVRNGDVDYHRGYLLHNRYTCHNEHVELRFSMPETSRYSRGDKSYAMHSMYCTTERTSPGWGGNLKPLTACWAEEGLLCTAALYHHVATDSRLGLNKVATFVVVAMPLIPEWNTNGMDNCQWFLCWRLLPSALGCPLHLVPPPPKKYQ